MYKHPLRPNRFPRSQDYATSRLNVRSHNRQNNWNLNMFKYSACRESLWLSPELQVILPTETHLSLQMISKVSQFVEESQVCKITTFPQIRDRVCQSSLNSATRRPRRVKKRAQLINLYFSPETALLYTCQI